MDLMCFRVHRLRIYIAYDSETASSNASQVASFVHYLNIALGRDFCEPKTLVRRDGDHYGSSSWNLWFII